MKNMDISANHLLFSVIFRKKVDFSKKWMFSKMGTLEKKIKKCTRNVLLIILFISLKNI